MINKYKPQEKKDFLMNNLLSLTFYEIENPIELANKVFDLEIFRSIFESRLLNTSKKNDAGVKLIDVVMMFKIMILQHYYNLVDKLDEYQIVDIMSFKKFLRL